MAKFLDLNGLETFLAKVKDWVNTLVNSTKSSLQSSINNKVDKTTTVNGHPLNGNVTVTKSDVSLGNVTNDAQVKRSEMGVASGVATLGSDGKLTSAQLPAFKSVNGTSVVGSGNITIDLTLYKVVEELPKSGIDSTKIYLVKSSNSGESDIYTEYMYVNSKWEKLGEHKSDVDLTPYVKFTDVATSSKAGAMSSTDKAKLDGIAPGANNYTHPTSSGNKHIPAGGSSGQILRWASDGTATWGNDNNTTYSAFKGATSSAAGGSGLVPAPAQGDNSSKYLKADGTWATPPNTVYTHPSYTSRSSGLYKITVDSTGHVSAATAVSKSDITALGIPGSDTNTTYSIATASTAGLVKPVSVITKPTLQSVTTTAGKYYQVQMSSDGNMFVNVPWTDTNTTYSLSSLGGVGTINASGSNGLTLSASKSGTTVTVSGSVNLRDSTAASNSSTYTAGGSSKFYSVQRDKDGYLGVYVPWTDTNTVYSLPLASSGTRGGIKIGYTSTTNNRAVQLSSEKAYVNIPTASSSTTGLMSSTMVSKLNGIASGATADSAIPTSVINSLS